MNFLVITLGVVWLLGEKRFYAQGLLILTFVCGDYVRHKLDVKIYSPQILIKFYTYQPQNVWTDSDFHKNHCRAGGRLENPSLKLIFSAVF